MSMVNVRKVSIAFIMFMVNTYNTTFAKHDVTVDKHNVMIDGHNVFAEKHNVAIDNIRRHC